MESFVNRLVNGCTGPEWTRWTLLGLNGQLGGQICLCTVLIKLDCFLWVRRCSKASFNCRIAGIAWFFTKYSSCPISDAGICWCYNDLIILMKICSLRLTPMSRFFVPYFVRFEQISNILVLCSLWSLSNNFLEINLCKRPENGTLVVKEILSRFRFYQLSRFEPVPVGSTKATFCALVSPLLFHCSLIQLMLLQCYWAEGAGLSLQPLPLHLRQLALRPARHLGRDHHLLLLVSSKTEEVRQHTISILTRWKVEVF